MAQPNEEQSPKGDGTDFTDLQSDLDKAKNERLKEEQKPNDRKDDLTTKTDVSKKKTGGGKQISPGT